MKLKKSIALILALVLTVAILPEGLSSAKAKTVTVAVGAKVTLSIKNPTSYKWSTSKPGVANVNKKGVVTGKKVGTAKITAKNKKNKKTVFTVKVVKTKTFKPQDMHINDSGKVLNWKNDSMNGSRVFLDGVFIENSIHKNDYEYYLWFNVDESAVSEGDHTVVFKKSGYKDYTFKFTFKAPDYSDQGLILTDSDDDQCWIDDDKSFWINLNPDAKDQNIVITFDGTAITPDESFVNNDTNMLNYVFHADTIAKLATPGTHTITAKSDNHPEEKTTYEVK